MSSVSNGGSVRQNAGDGTPSLGLGGGSDPSQSRRARGSESVQFGAPPPGTSPSGKRRLHAAGICDCCEGPPEEESAVDGAVATDLILVTAENWTPENAPAVDAPFEQAHGTTVAGAT